MNAPSDDAFLLDVAVSTARAAGRHALDHKPRRVEVHQRFAHDIKLQLDRECQAVAAASIHARCPDAPILGEEASHGEQTPAGLQWVVDPIDGTLNFFHGLPWWCCSVAVRRGDQVVAGAVYAPELDRMYAASRTTTSTLNGEPIRVSATRDLAEALLVSGSEKEMTPGHRPLDTAQSLAGHVRKVRILGAAALDLCQIAEGSIDVFCQNGLYLWDVAAAGLIIERAGGVYRQRPTTEPGRYRCLAAAHADLADAVDAIPLP
jgi:myo-inositol-1(or 4)-monophosphatase